MSPGSEAMERPGFADMWRTARTPRWLAALAGLVAFIIACVLLGQWQWDRTQDILDAERAAAAEPVLLERIVVDDESWDNAEIGRDVILEGRFTGDDVLLDNREFQGVTGSWVLTRFELSTGASVAVMRGWLPPGESLPPLESGPVRIEGVLHPNEAFYEGANNSTIVTADSAALAQAWGVPLIDGYVMLQMQDPTLIRSDSNGPVVVPPTVQVGDVPFPLQNFFYAIQWWVFAAFALFVYARWLYLDARK